MNLNKTIPRGLRKHKCAYFSILENRVQIPYFLLVSVDFRIIIENNIKIRNKKKKISFLPTSNCPIRRLVFPGNHRSYEFFADVVYIPIIPLSVPVFPNRHLRTTGLVSLSIMNNLKLKSVELLLLYLP